MNTTQAQQKALDDALVALADHLEFGKCNMRLKTDIKPKEATFQVVLDALALTPFYRAFLITADFCPKILRQKFEDLPLEHDILSFIRDHGYTEYITYLTDVNVDYLHQPWRAFVTIINKCLSGKETRMDKIRLSHAKKTDKMSYPRFTKIIIDYLMSKDQSISRRNKMFWHTARDDTMFTSMRCISRHEDTQVYAKASSSYQSISCKSKAKVSKSDKKKQPAEKTKAKGLAVLSKVALTKAEQLKLATKRSKTQFHSSHASGSGDGVDTQSKVPDEQQQKSSGTDKGTGTKPGVPDVPIYESESEKESWDDSEDEDDENDSDDLSVEGNDNNDGDDDDANDEDKQEGDETNDDDEENDSDITESDRIKIHILDLAPNRCSTSIGKTRGKATISSAFTCKLPHKSDNPSPADNEIASLMVTTAQHATTIPEIKSSFTTPVPPPPPFFNPLQQEATPIPTPTTSETTTYSLQSKFAFGCKFYERVFNLEKDVSEINQVDQYAQALSSILAIFDRYMDNKLREAINKAILAHNLDCRQEAQT
ncbi:hypothetical protein Tco_0111468 [Tanacetum coccineum]